MPIFYSPVELIELAVSLERNGAQFYQELSKSTSAKPLKNLFVFLAKEEKKHERFFRTLYKKTQEDPTTIAYNFDEMKLYLKAITESRFFRSPQSVLSKLINAKTPQKILSYAIDFEKETLLFYLELSSMVKDEHQKLLTEIVSQERSHIKKLSEIKESI